MKTNLKYVLWGLGITIFIVGCSFSNNSLDKEISKNLSARQANLNR